MTPSEGSSSDSFVAVKTPWILALQILVFIGIELAVFLVPHFLLGHKYATPDALPYYILMYAHGALWFVVFLFDRILWSQHRKVSEHGWRGLKRSMGADSKNPCEFVF